MPARVMTSVENNFTKGLITEATGLNFPENAATDASNCEFTLIGDVVRRLGYDQEVNGTFWSETNGALVGEACATFIWDNPGGQSNKTILVRQIGSQLYFYDVSASTNTLPLSKQLLADQILGLSNFVATNAILDPSEECQFAAGNGYLFVYQTTCDPFYCTYNAGTITGTLIPVKIRDFVGVLDSSSVSTRPLSLSNQHLYNLINQGWTQGSPWLMQSVSSPPTVVASGSVSFQVPSGVSGVSNGQFVSVSNINAARPGAGPVILPNTPVMGGTVTSYSGTTLTVNITESLLEAIGSQLGPYNITPYNQGYINTWFAATGNYPSNADVWWYFKNSSGSFDPVTTLNQVTLNTGNAPQGHTVLNAFVQQRSLLSGITGISDVITPKRPTTGTFWQGRVWYAGVNDSAASTSTTPFYSWNGNIYYSTTIQTPADFGICYQTNDPTSENLNGELPTDGGVIVIPETGTIHKLFPIQNGMLVFANNGVWFITGSQGIGFASNDYTVTKISSIKSISAKSFVDVMGLPYFWNEEGIYAVTPSQNNSLSVDPLTVGTILSFYNNIPIQSKKYARASYDPVNYVIQWVYRSTQETGIGDRYFNDSILNYNVYNKAFFPYSIVPSLTGTQSGPYITDVTYVTYPTIDVDTPLPTFKYSVQYINSSTYEYTFAEEINEDYVDWNYILPVDYTSTYTTGYKVHGKGLFKTTIPYITVFSRTDGEYQAYYIQGVWDYSINSDSNRWSSNQFVEIFDTNTSMVVRRHRIRGRGYTLQLRFTSVPGQPFDFMGWAIYEVINSGV